MSMPLAQFTEAYTKLLVAAWSDEGFATQLQDAPRTAAAEVGLEIPDRVQVHVVAPQEGAAQDLADYHREFEAGITAGSVDIVVPQAPMVDLQDLNADQLAEIAGGVACCCCCPCCCCN